MSAPEDIFDEMERDSKVDETNLSGELSKIPYLHAKWLKRYHALNRQLRGCEQRLAEVKLKRSNYYMGFASDSEYAVAPLFRKVLKTDLNDVLAADPEYSKAYDDVEVVREVAVLVEKFISSLNNRGYNLGKAVDFIRWKNGG